MSELAALLIAYLLGTLPTGYLLTRFIAGVDLRS
ncbi:MAG TPA: acyl-phosphate glycerol 3-phosphate acyltransferase, partial [Chloroflexi bacterium]|nr:acyl-phosphate glycerol 3-phosphate acyltransferase [Chloroflexota bacterium]